MNAPGIPDALERQHALDPTQSFIVQAPAGSGKTGLLIQRYLKLLACVDEPEEIVAITFTRKAAAEMRERVLAALDMGKLSESDPDSAYEKVTYALSVAVLQRDGQMGWHLTENPVRLRIQTIDSLCASLTRQMPMLSKFGSQPESIEDASDFYREAARLTIEWVDQDHAIAQDIEQLLEHLDNNSVYIEQLLAEMLSRRDHWLRHIHGKTRDELEAALKQVRREALTELSCLFPSMVRNELFELVCYAAANLAVDDSCSPIIACADLDASVGNWDVDHWYGICELLLTQKDAWRKTINIKNGFPAGKTKTEKVLAKSWKDRALVLIEMLADNEPLHQALVAMRYLPPPTYTDMQWNVLGAMTQLLPHAVAQLKIIFQSHCKVDFTEVVQGALLALGEPEVPTDLALALDYRIKHLLIDEFQDTSISQYKLIEKLITGWEVGDGRSLFAVGDPMQSIYRFREAEVGLFLSARTMGIGNLALQPLTLCANFRSQQGIVDWVNTTFERMMPVHEDVSKGAVAYTSSVATCEGLTETAVTVHAFFNHNAIAEAKKIVEIILQSRRDNPSASIAILVRNRGHLNEIIPQIKVAGLRFRAIEIEVLGNKAVVQDLLILTRALINPADRLAWFALLRAPWCGLILADLYALASINPNQEKNNKKEGGNGRTVWELLNNEMYLSALSADGTTRLQCVQKILAPCMHNRYRQSLRATVEAAWLALGGPGCMSPGAHNTNLAANGMDDAMIYLDYLETHEEAGNIPDLARFEKGLAKLYASSDLDADDGLQIMTIHKAKGLEFDCVIVPGLGRLPRSTHKQLLKWMERSRSESADKRDTGDADLLLAPIQETGVDDDPITMWMARLDSEKEHFETERLLYVAATRAKQYLHLLGSAGLASNKDGLLEPKQPAARTLLNKLWSTVKPVYMEAAEKLMPSSVPCLAQGDDVAVETKAIVNQSIYRLTSDWTLPAAPQALVWHQPRDKTALQDEVEFSWVGEKARHIGSVVHRWLQEIAEDEMQGWHVARILALRETFKQGLIASGMSTVDKEIEIAVERVMLALTYSVNDKRGQWILGPRQNAHNELRMTGVINGERVDLAMDRTFFDEGGNQWIIDYKTSSHEGSDMEAFLDREQQRYRDQLNRYAVLMQTHDKRPVHLGLYFPLLRGWRTWDV
tara:strand:- start:3007 stop:6498 length:3492 start_codon:yes stop_codon:yes gene_type:complete